MVKETGFYDLLGVSLRADFAPKSSFANSFKVGPNASDAELKTAYKKGALKHHPGMARYYFLNSDNYVLMPLQIKMPTIQMLPRSSKKYRMPTKSFRIARNAQYMISMARKA